MKKLRESVKRDGTESKIIKQTPQKFHSKVCR